MTDEADKCLAEIMKIMKNDEDDHHHGIHINDCSELVNRTDFLFGKNLANMAIRAIRINDSLRTPANKNDEEMGGDERRWKEMRGVWRRYN